MIRGFRLPALLLVTSLLLGTALAGPIPGLFTFNPVRNHNIEVGTYPPSNLHNQYEPLWLVSDDFSAGILTAQNSSIGNFYTSKYPMWTLFASSPNGARENRNPFAASTPAPDVAGILDSWTIMGNSSLIALNNGGGSASWQGSYSALAGFNVPTSASGLNAASLNAQNIGGDNPEWKKVPEPTSLTLMGTGLVALAAMLRRKLRPV